MKVKSFVSSIITLLLGIAVSVITFLLIKDVSATEGLQSLGLIVLIPVGIIMLLISMGLSVSSVTTSSIAITSNLKAIKIISIILLILSLGLLGLTIADIVKFIQVF